MRMIWKSSARDMVADPTREGWAALALCIIKGVSLELAFEMLTDPSACLVRQPKLTDKDFEDIEALKAQGVSWTELGYMYGRERTAMCHAVRRHREKKEKREV